MIKASILILLKGDLFNVSILTIYGLDTFKFDTCCCSSRL